MKQKYCLQFLRRKKENLDRIGKNLAVRENIGKIQEISRNNLKSEKYDNNINAEKFDDFGKKVLYKK